MICRHCNTNKVSRPRGLCWTCYYTPGVQAMYPSTSKFARRGVGNFFMGSGAMPTPTAELPGTPSKVAVLEERAARGERLWHPQDGLIEACAIPPA